MNYTSFSFENYTPTFTYKSTRTTFVNKVFSIVGVQLLITAITILVLQSSVHFQALSEALALPAFILALGSSLVLAFSRELARKTPHNYILLAVFTFSEALIVNTILYHYSLETISKAFLTTALLVGSIAYAAKNADYDMTSSKFFTYAALLHLVIVLISAFIMRIDHIIMAYIGAAMFCAYLYFDLQLLMGDKAKMISVDDYVFASINIYVDVIGLFVNMVQILGEYERKKKREERRR